MSFDATVRATKEAHLGLNPFRAGRCLSTTGITATACGLNVSIPFEQGDVFRRRTVLDVLLKWMVSIPFEQGDVFRP